MPPASSVAVALRVQISLSFVHLSNFVSFVRLTLRGVGQLQWYHLKAEVEILTEMSVACELSILWTTIPSLLQSNFASVKRCLMTGCNCEQMTCLLMNLHTINNLFKSTTLRELCFKHFQKNNGWRWRKNAREEKGIMWAVMCVSASSAPM